MAPNPARSLLPLRGDVFRVALVVRGTSRSVFTEVLKPPYRVGYSSVMLPAREGTIFGSQLAPVLNQERRGYVIG